ncbi:hypothetical protein [Pandoraea sp. NPDC087047]|uniref:hypothetical protein n=1 Tax=Pandoraea sp. NPDC087047 TaxID=3364390 RepID=UPI0038212A05
MAGNLRLGRRIGMARMAAILADAGAGGPGFDPGGSKLAGHSGARTIPLESLQDGCAAAFDQCITCLEG